MNTGGVVNPRAAGSLHNMGRPAGCLPRVAALTLLLACKGATAINARTTHTAGYQAAQRNHVYFPAPGMQPRI